MMLNFSQWFICEATYYNFSSFAAIVLALIDEGSLVHPEIPAILISPICPHTILSSHAILVVWFGCLSTADRDAAVGIAKAREEMGSQTDEDLLLTPELAALVLTQGRRLKFSCSVKSCSRSRSGLHSGVDTPGRFAGPTHCPPHINPHHIDHQFRTPSPTLSNSSDDSEIQLTPQAIDKGHYVAPSTAEEPALQKPQSQSQPQPQPSQQQRQ
ncbi:hypothetical protein EDD22DRAFT_1003858 [Suillus occidentalis]|nr:hypothetical protein EDD22DRAFT_1003858 [Suillus occidentalis]